MGLIDVVIDSYKRGMGLLAPTQEDVKLRENMLGLIADFTPVTGDAKSVYEGIQAARKGDYLGAGLGGLGMLPLIPSMAGMIKTPVGRIAERATESDALADMLERAGRRAGYTVSRSDSSISPSRYVSFTKAGDDIGDTTRQVRISNHADKNPELANGVRTSSDPETGVSFEQAVNWLSREGFPTSLSARYKNVPTWEQYYAAKRAESPKVDPKILLDRLTWKFKHDPKYSGPEPTMEMVLRDYANVITK